MIDSRRKLLVDLTQSEEVLADVVGYFECFDDGKSLPMLCAIAFFFGGLKLYVVAQEDDSVELYRDSWRPDPRLEVISLMKRKPWSLAKGKPLLWAWTMFNQQGYFDGLQLEFARDSEDLSFVVQLLAMGCEVKQRVVESECSTVAFSQ